MNLFKKAAVSLAATSLVMAPVAASAAQSVRASSVVEGQSELEGSNWLLIALAIAAVVVGIVLLTDDDKPTSP